MKKEYDPRNVMQYANTTFLTKSGSRYSVDKHGRFHGRSSMEGAKIEMIASGGKSLYKGIVGYFGVNEREEAQRTIEQHGRKVKEGDFLAICLTEEDAKKYIHPWLVTSKIVRIIKIR